MADLTGKTIASTYKDLLQVSNSNDGIDGTLRVIEDGEGTESILSISSSALKVGTSSQLQFRDSAIHISSDADGYLNVQADTGVNINIGGTDELAVTATTSTFGTNLVIPDSGTIGNASDTDLLTFTSGVLTVAGELDATTLDISGNADIDGTLEADAITVDGTALAEFISDTTGAMFSSNTETGITVTYQDGDNTVDVAIDAAQTTVTSLLATDIKIGEDDQTKVDFETADEIHFYAANVEQVYLGDNIFGPQSDSDVDLGATGVRWKDAFVDSITVTGEVDGASLDISGDADIDGTLEVNAITVTGTITYGSLSDGAITITAFVDEDDMSTNSATLVPTQQSVKAYVDASTTAQDLDISADSGSNIAIDLDSEVLAVSGGEGIDTSITGNAITIAGEEASTSNKGVASFSSDNFAVSSGAVTIKDNGVILATETTGDYVQNITGGTGIASNGATSGENIAHTLSIDLNELTTETTIADADFIAMVDATDSASGKITFENLEDAIFASVSGDIAIAEDGAATIQANSVALATDTTGNFVATVADSGTGGITVANSGSENAGVTLEFDVNGLTVAAIASGDQIAFSDEGAAGDPSKKESIDDIATLFAGTGLTASSAVIGIDAAQTGITSLLVADIVIGEDAETKIDFETANEIHFDANNVERLNIASGTTTTYQPIAFSGSGVVNQITFTDSSQPAGVFYITSALYSGGGGNPNILKSINSTIVQVISNTGGVELTSGATSFSAISSDERLKQNWNNFENATDKINTLTKIGEYQKKDPITNDFPKSTNIDGNEVAEDKKFYGLSANEVQKILPLSAIAHKDGYLGLNYQDVFVLSLKAIQELSEQNKLLKERVTALENA